MAVRVLRIFENRESEDPDSNLVDVLVGDKRPSYLVTMFCNGELVVYRNIRPDGGWTIEKRLSNWGDT